MTNQVNDQANACETFRHALSSLQHAQHLLLLKQTVDGVYLPVVQYTAAVVFIQKPVQTGSAQCPML